MGYYLVTNDLCFLNVLIDGEASSYDLIFVDIAFCYTVSCFYALYCLVRIEEVRGEVYDRTGI